jgi:cytochrome c oxidase assembly protein subunit 15
MVVLQLPLLLAAAHNAGAALLLLAVIALNHRAWRP